MCVCLYIYMYIYMYMYMDKSVGTLLDIGHAASSIHRMAYVLGMKE